MWCPPHWAPRTLFCPITCGAYLARPAALCSSRSSTTHSAMRRSSSVRDCGSTRERARVCKLVFCARVLHAREDMRACVRVWAKSLSLSCQLPEGPTRVTLPRKRADLVQHGRDVRHEGLHVGQHRITKALEERADGRRHLAGVGGWVDVWMGCVVGLVDWSVGWVGVKKPAGGGKRSPGGLRKRR